MQQEAKARYMFFVDLFTSASMYAVRVARVREGLLREQIGLVLGKDIIQDYHPILVLRSYNRTHGNS